MANFKYYESDYELAVLELLESCGWDYMCGCSIHREKGEAILREDLREYLNRRHGYFSDDEIDTLISYLNSCSNPSLYRSMKGTYQLLSRGYLLHRDDGSDLFIDFFDFGPGVRR